MDELVNENKELNLRLEEAEQTLKAIKSGEIDAIITDDSKVYTLEGSDHLYRVMVQNMSDGVVTLTPEGTIFYCNTKFASLLKLPLEQMPGQKLNNFVHPDDLKIYENIREQGLWEEKKCEVNLESADGTVIPVSITIKTIKGLKGLYVIITDLREQKYYENLQKTQNELIISNEELKVATENLLVANERIQEQMDALQKLTDLIELSYDAIIVLELDGRIERWNEGAQRLYGYSKSEIMGQNLHEVLSTTFSNPWPQFRTELIDKGTWEGELIHRTKNGREVIVNSRLQLNTRDDGSNFVLEINRDITQRKKAEKQQIMMLKTEQQLTEKLSNTNKELKVAQNNLNELIDKLKLSNKELEQFAYVASHDLQEPLRMVSSFTQLLERRYKNNLDADADEFIGFIVAGAKRMKDLIDDLLTFSRLNTEAREFETFFMELALDDVLINLKPSINENNVQISHNALPKIYGDRSQVTQLLQNLITNAIKFHGDEPPKIHISSEESKNEWIICVRDNGIGIDPDHQEQIFSIFKRLHSIEEYEGTGIGLAICKRIVNRHGGSIWVESEEGKGSNFYFSIPKI